MKLERKSILKGVVISGMIAGAMPAMANSTDLFNYDTMGSGAELRAELLEQYGSPIDVQNLNSEDFLLGENKCGEGKCGEKAKKEGTKEAKKSETKEKTSEAKCGEAKCGEKGKKEATKEAKKESKSKTSEAKCGESTCGGGK
ncbi:hypothetical protein [Labilibacter marinus]|uniref:hypothetical protein n=1 Tax=Labilibacter marinus TaxID=1477105 RepID=UPI000836C063|nr:hypothetical protein [Labilibacter marinus]